MTRSLIWHHLSVPSESTLSPDSAVAGLVRWREYLHISYFKCSFFVLKGLHSCKQTYILLCFYPFILLITCSTSIKPERACLFKNPPAHKLSPLWLVSSLSIVFLHKLCWCFMQQCNSAAILGAWLCRCDITMSMKSMTVDFHCVLILSHNYFALRLDLESKDPMHTAQLWRYEMPNWF